MQNLFRRPSGVWVARLAVPARLRQSMGRREFIQSTRTTDPAIGKLIGSALLTQWRRAMFNADRSAGRIQMELEDEVLLRIIDGSPALIGAAHMPLKDAARASGISVEELLREAAAGTLRLYARLADAPGNVLPYESLAFDDVVLGTRIVPCAASMPDHARRESVSGACSLLADDAQAAANRWLADPTARLVFHLLDVGGGGLVFAHDDAPGLLLAAVEVAVEDVERLRAFKAAGIGAQAIDSARARVQARATPTNAVAGLRNGSRPLRDSIEKYIEDAERPRGHEQRERIRRACEIFLVMMGADLTGNDLNRDILTDFRDVHLPTFPAEEAKLRLKHKTSNLAESIQKAREVGWACMSAPQRVKHFGWLCGWVEWLGQGEWTGRGIADGLAQRGQAAVQVQRANAGRTNADRRDPFTADELAAIFEADWFKAGRGKLTRRGRHHQWSPYKTFVPLIGLLTGARINEICQLHLNDLRKNEHGTWLFTVTISEFDEPDDPGMFNDSDAQGKPNLGTKRLKNGNAQRAVPVHSELLRLGLIEYRDALKSAGYTRLFPELKHDEQKGYGKAATKWFNDAYLGKKLGIPRDGRKVFHSFRHNVATTLQNDLAGRPLAVKQLLGHARGSGEAEKTYRKDMEATGPDSELVKLVEGLRHEFLAELAPLDIKAGLEAVTQAMRRKNQGRGAVED